MKQRVMESIYGRFGRIMIITVLIIDVLLILLLAAGAAVSWLRAGDESEAAAGPAADEVARQFGGPDRPGRFVARLPEPFRTILFQMDLDKEGNFASLFSALHFFAIGILSLNTAFNLPSARRILRATWICLASGFFVLFLDEAFSFHSAVSPQGATAGAQPLVELLGREAAFFLLFLLPLAIGAAILIFTCSFTFQRHRLSRFLSYAAVASWLLSLVLDSVGADAPLRYYRLVSFCEESLEIGGSVLMLAALLGYLRTQPAETPAMPPESAVIT